MQDEPMVVKNMVDRLLKFVSFNKNETKWNKKKVPDVNSQKFVLNIKNNVKKLINLIIVYNCLNYNLISFNMFTCYNVISRGWVTICL